MNTQPEQASFTPGVVRLSRDRDLLDEENFCRQITIERKRAERSGRSFALILLEVGQRVPSDRCFETLAALGETLVKSFRESDVVGWHPFGRGLGIICSELTTQGTVAPVVLQRIQRAIHAEVSAERFPIKTSVQVYPETWEYELSRRPSNPALYPELRASVHSRGWQKDVKRLMDVIGSSLLLLLALPLLVAISIAIKLTSRGPILFRQNRVGYHGRPFVFLKFRSMYSDSDVKIHQQWFNEFVSGKAQRQTTGGKGEGSFKLVRDPRVTPIGRFLRRSSLDELPQLINVLKGEMSLVGPRPPIPYEVSAYEAWHRARVLEAKPGLTGLWQVSGRSRVTFDEMVRLDVQYAREWSLWLDIKILLRTPLAVLLGEGAY